MGSSLWCNWRCNWETHGMNRARLRAELRNDVPMEWSQRNFQRPKLPKPECVWFNDRRVKKSHLKKKSYQSYQNIIICRLWVATESRWSYPICCPRLPRPSSRFASATFLYLASVGYSDGGSKPSYPNGTLKWLMVEKTTFPAKKMP